MHKNFSSREFSVPPSCYCKISDILSFSIKKWISDILSISCVPTSAGDTYGQIWSQKRCPDHISAIAMSCDGDE